MPKRIGVLFAALCVTAVTALIYFAQAAATQSAPSYSTWNTTPGGAKLLFDGLSQAGFVQVSRQFKPVDVEKPRQATVFFLGVDAFRLDHEQAPYFEAMEQAAKRGNNLVIAVPEEHSYTFKYGDEESLLASRWGVRFVSEKGDFSARPVVDKNWKALPDNVWQRTFGNGSITLVARGQRLDNKGIAREEANRQLLLELVGQYPTVIFEEAHLGIRESGSIVGLARHYHLQGLMAGFILLAGMFIWSRSVSFPPPRAVEAQAVLGSDTRSMLTELMSRHLKGQLIQACVAEWNRTRAQAAALAVPAATNPVAAYANIQKSLEKKSKFTI